MISEQNWTRIDGCRSCGSSKLQEILDLGYTPLADALISPGMDDEDEIFAPLLLLKCTECHLVQISVSVDPEILFCRDYPYYSSVSPHLVDHFRSSAESIISKYGIDGDSLVIEAASNDGYMLQFFKKAGADVLGIDPAEGPANVALERGIPTRIEFFTGKLAMEYQGAADVFLANNVLAHVPDLNGFVRGISTVLRDDGIAVIEVPYLADLIEKLEFDTIYHQHLCYFSITSLSRLLENNGLFLNDVERTAIHGGSLRLFIGKKDDTSENVRRMMDDEKTSGYLGMERYERFARDIDRTKKDLMVFLEEQKKLDRMIIGYGAAAKATTLMSHFGIDGTHLSSIADLNPKKHGKLMGGNHIPIVSRDVILKEMPDFVLVLAWNFIHEIMSQNKEYLERGGRFIVPIPEFRLIGRDSAEEE